MIKRFWTLFLFLCLPLSAQTDPAALEADLAQSTGAARLEILLELARSELEAHLIEQAEPRAVEALALAQELEEIESIARAHALLGKIRHNLSRFSEALESSAAAVEIYEDLDQRRALAEALLDVGFSYFRLGELSRALEIDLRALRIAEDLGDELLAARLLNNLGIVHRRLGRFEDSKAFYSRALEIAERLGEIDEASRLYNNLGVLDRDLGDLESALERFNRSLEYSHRIGHDTRIFVTLGNLALTYYDLGELERARSYFDEALAYYREAELHFPLGEIFTYRARLERARGNEEAALADLLKAIAEASKTNSREALTEAWAELAELHANAGRFAQAYAANRSASTIAESLLGEKGRRRVAELEARYEAEERERQIERLQQEQTIAELERSRLRTANRTLVIAAVLLVIILALWASRMRFKAQVAAARARQEESRHYIDVLEGKNIEIAARSAELESFLYTVSHDLKSPVVTISGFIGLIERDAREGDLDRLLHDLGMVRRAARHMAQLLDELVELSRIGRTEEKLEELALDEVLAAAAERLQDRFETHKIALTIEPGLPHVRGDRRRLIEVFENLLANALEHMGETAEPPRVEIFRRDVDRETETSRTVLVVRDNGRGILPAYHEKIFGLFERLEADARGTGIGLAMVRRIIEHHQGRIWVESRGRGDGASFCVVLPWIDSGA